jgi:hypothetical protein
MAGAKIALTSTAGELQQDANGNAKVNTPLDITQVGYTAIASEVDDGTVLGSRTMKQLESSEDYRLRVGVDQLIMNMSFEGTTIAQGHIQQNLTSFTVAQASGFLSLNNGNSVTTGQGGNIRTYRTFPLLGSYTTYFEYWAREANETATNAVSEWGAAYFSGIVALPLDGIFFRRTSGGQLKAVINFGGTETETIIDTTNVPGRDGSGAFSASECNHYLIAVHNDSVQFWINDILVSHIATPATQGGPSSCTSLPMAWRVYNSGTSSAARRFEVGFISVSYGDPLTTKDWGTVMSGGGQGAYQAQIGSTSGQTSNYANSAAPASATLSNTAAGYTTLGGQYQFAASATNETDWALFGYQNPTGSSILPGKTLYVTSIRIGEMHVTGAAAVNATMFFWSAGVGSTAVSLATTDAAATVGPRRVPLGSQGFLAAAAIGSTTPGFTVDFSDAPLVVPAGQFFHIVVKQLNGAATASLVWRGMVTVVGYFE